MASSYEPSWDSLEKHAIPEWLKNTSLGIYFHWGPYSVPSNGDGWYPRNMYREESDTYDYHSEQFGDPAEFGYKDFVPLFDGAEFDADEVAALCESVGAEFVGMAVVHHDGFAMWDSDVTEWNAANMGPERDIVGELVEAVRARDMKFVAAFHHGWNWWYYPRKEGYDTMDAEYAGLYSQPHEEGEDPPEEYFADWRDKTLEVMETYRPDLAWFDFGWGNSAFAAHDEYRRDVVSGYYNMAEEWGKEVDVAHKRNLPVGTGVLDYERTRKETISNSRWVTDTSVDRESWVANPDPDYKSAGTLVRGLVDRVSKNGTTLLNLCPQPSGEIPAPQRERVVELGEWLDANDEAVSRSRPAWTFGEGPTEVTSGEFEEASRIEFTEDDRRFTRSDDGNYGYVFLMEWPSDGETTVETPIERALSENTDEWRQTDYDIELLGSDRDVEWQLTDTGLNVTVGETPPESCDHAYTLRLEL